MATTEQVGQGVGSLLGLFLGHKAGSSTRKKRLKAKADLDEKALQEARDKEARAAKLAIFLKGDRLAPEQEQQFLTSQGFAPTTEQNLFRDISRTGFQPGTDEESIFREEKERRKKLELLERFGFNKETLRKGIESGSVDLPQIGQRTAADIAGAAKTEAGTGKLEAETRLVEKKLLTELQLAEANKQLADLRKRTKPGGKPRDPEAELRKQFKVSADLLGQDLDKLRATISQNNSVIRTLSADVTNEDRLQAREENIVLKRQINFKTRERERLIKLLSPTITEDNFSGKVKQFEKLIKLRLISKTGAMKSFMDKLKRQVQDRRMDIADAERMTIKFRELIFGTK